MPVDREDREALHSNTGAFRFRLYEENGPTAPPAGMAVSIENEVWRLTQAFELSNYGSIRWTSKNGNSPWGSDDIEWDPKLDSPDTFSIVLTTMPLTPQHLFVKNRYAVVSNANKPQSLALTTRDFYLYFCMLAILRFYTRPLHSHMNIADCPMDLAFDVTKLGERSDYRGLCSNCLDVIREYHQKEGVDSALSDATLEIMQLVGDRAWGRSRSSQSIPESAEKPEESARHSHNSSGETHPREVVVDFKVGTGPEPGNIKSGEAVDSRDTSTSGRFGAMRDDHHPTDALGYRDYAQAFAELITDVETETPLSIGLFAPWGKGKTVLLHFIDEAIISINSKSSVAPDTVLTETIHFNAWEHSKAEQISTGFMDVVFRHIEKSIPWWARLKLALRLNINLRRNPEILRAFCVLTAVVAAIALFIVLVAAGTLEVPLTLVGWITGGVSIFALVGVLVTKGLAATWNAAHHPITQRILSLASLPSFKETLDPTLQLKEDIKKGSEAFCDATKKKRIAVFVDDIDRCEPSKILEVLEAIRHFLDLEGFVFVLAMDAKVVRKGLGENYDFMCETPFDREHMGSCYLDKLIQVMFSIPELSSDQRVNLWNSITRRVVTNVIVTPEAATAIAGTVGPVVLIDGVPVGGALQDAREVPRGGPLSEESRPIKSDEQPHRSRLSENENQMLRSLLSTEQLSISPRLIKRYLNTYMLARHLLFTQWAKSNTGMRLRDSNRGFAVWLVATTVFPFESAALLKWLKQGNWKNPFLEGGVFSGDGRFLLVQHRPSRESDSVSESPFDGLNANSLSEFGALLVGLSPNWDQIFETVRILECFSPVAN